MCSKNLRRTNEHNENFNEEVRKYKNQTGLKNTITEIENTLEGINSRLYDPEEHTSELADRVGGNHQANKKNNVFKMRQFNRPL